MSHPLALSIRCNVVHVAVNRNRQFHFFVQSGVRKEEAKDGRLSDIELSEGNE